MSKSWLKILSQQFSGCEINQGSFSGILKMIVLFFGFCQRFSTPLIVLSSQPLKTKRD
jgi:hypothetical protein